MLKITANGKFLEIDDGTTLVDLLKKLDYPSIDFGIAASVNGDVIDRTHWETTTLREGDSIDVIKAFQGG